MKYLSATIFAFACLLMFVDDSEAGCGRRGGRRGRRGCGDGSESSAQSYGGSCAPGQQCAPGQRDLTMPGRGLSTGQEFQVGDHVSHVANSGGLFPDGTGVITAKIPWNAGDGFSYQVRCDKTGKVLPVNFKGSELKAVDQKESPPKP